MTRLFNLLIFLLISLCSFANIDYIDISKISSDKKYVEAFNFIKDNQRFYSTWTNEWTYDQPKENLIRTLRSDFSLFSSLTVKNAELNLLLGDIAHYLYNLDDTAFFHIAVDQYSEAIKSNLKDYRGFWFLGFHYSLSNIPVLAIENLFKAEKLLSPDAPAEFWDEYAMVTAIAGMPSHTIFAMDKYKSIAGKTGSFESQLGETTRKQIVDVNKDKNYNKEEIWTIGSGRRYEFASRPLGIKLSVDTTWNFSIYDYSNRQAAFIMKPPVLRNKKGKEIHYTIALIMKVAESQEKLEDFVSNFISKYPTKLKITFSNRFEKTIAYEIKDKTMYPEIGGAHLYMIGVERNSPKYPGLLLENPVELQGKDNYQMQFYKPTESKNRFQDKIFYAILLDSCEDIHEQSYDIFKTLFEQHMVIE